MIKVGKNSYIDKTSILKSDVVIGDNCYIGPFNVIENSIIGDDVIINHSFIVDSNIGSSCKIGPFAHIRKKSRLGNNCRIGNYVEIKNSTLEEGVKCAHLSYIGDSYIGEKTNVGCGVVTANYDGKEKHQTYIGKRCFIGCKSIFIAPVKVEDDCFIAAGTIVNKDIEARSYAISRSELKIKENKNRLID